MGERLMTRGWDMQISGGMPLGYANVAILTALLKHLTEINVITPQSVSDVLVEATKSLESLGYRNGVLDAVKVVAEVRSDLEKQGVI